MVGRSFRLPCSDSDDSDDDVLSIGPLRPIVTAAPLGGAEGHDVEVRQINLRNEWSVDSWTADDSCGEACAQLDNLNWFLPADDRVGACLPHSCRWICRTVRTMLMMLCRIRFRCR